MRVVLRCDASPQLGLGHLRRCLNLAQAVERAGGRVAIASHALPARLHAQVIGPGYGLIALDHEDDTQGLRDAARDFGAEWVVLDSYAAGSESVARCAAPGWKLCVIDDLGTRDLTPADLVLDFTPGAPRPGGLYGPRYALLDQAFTGARTASRARVRVARGRAVVTLGGSPPVVTLEAVAQQLERGGVSALDVVLGLRSGESLGGSRRLLHGPLEPSAMARLMAAADLAVAPPSTTAWELACLGVPTILVQTAANQTRNAEACARLGLPVVEGEEVEAGLTALDDPLRRARWLTLCDGRGAERVAAAFGGEPERLVVLPSDGGQEQAEWVLAWRNDPHTRSMSLGGEAIAWDAHWPWWQALHTDPQRLQLIGWYQGRPCGAVRFDARADGSALVNVVVAPDHRGQGLASPLLRASFEPLGDWGLAASSLRAEIRADNVPSRRAFAAAGFSRAPALEEGEDLTVWVRDLDPSGGP